MSKSFKRILTMMLALTMLIGFVPGISIHVHAAGTLNAGVEGLLIEYTDFVGTGNNTKLPEISHEEGDKSITYHLGNGETPRTKGGYVDLILTNQLETEAILFFRWDASATQAGSGVTLTYKGSNGAEVVEILLEGNTVQGNGEKVKEIVLQPNASVVFRVTIANTGRNAIDQVTLKLMDLSLYQDVKVLTTFKAVNPEQGSYTVNGQLISEDTVIAQSATENYDLVAIPAEGYVFAGWYSETEQTIIATGATAQVKLATDQTILPLFIKAEEAVWGVGDANFTNLKDAFHCAERSETKVVTLLRDYTLTENVTIPEGVVLLIPFDEARSCYTTNPAPLERLDEDNDGYLDYNLRPWETPYAYRTLTIAENVVLTVEGEMSVSAIHHGGQGNSGAPHGACGFVMIEKNAKIVVADGGALYAWGYVVGNGSVEALSGAAVYELMQFTDFRGGSATTAFLPNSSLDEEELAKRVVFPFSQYYVQNIETALTIYQGAKECVFATVFAANSNQSVMLDFIGTSNAMFRMEEGASITKRYDGATDRLVIDVSGDVSLNGLTVDLSQMGQSGTMDSSIFNLPITNNITINVNDGTTTVNQNVALLAGVVVNIAEQANLYISHGWNLYVYDRDDWMKDNFVHANAHLRPIGWSYANGTTKIRNNDSLLDAVINVNGLLEADGYIYSTAGGANVFSSEGTGVVLLWYGNGKATETWQTTQSDTNVTFVSIPLTVLQLKNADGSYCATRPTEAGYMYNVTTGMWESVVKVHFDGNGATSGSMQDVEVEALDVIVPTDSEGNVYNEIQLPENGFVRTGYAFVAWNTQADGKGISYQPGDMYAVFQNETLYAVWACQHTNTHLENYKEPTCTEEGYSGDLICACGYVVQKGEVTAKAEHTYTKNLRGALKTAGNCTTEAVYAAKCDNCAFQSDVVTVKGEKDASKHTGTVVYTNNGETHSAAYNCCEAVCVANEPHTYDQEDDKCICGAVKPHVCSENLTEHKAVTPTCEYAGNTAYWSCTCGKFYADATATQEIAKDSWILPKAEHTFTKNLRGTLKTAGNCTTEAVYAAKCDNCAFQSDVVTVKGEKDASKHTGTVVYTNNGETHSAAYNCCEAVYVANEPHTYDQEDDKCICGAVKPHVCAENLTEHKAVTPDCQTVGNTAYWSCTCGKFYADANATQEIAKDSWILGKGDHAFTQNLRGSVKTPGNCTTETVYAVKCDKCDVESEDLTIKGEKEASKHSGTPVYTNNGDTHSAAYNCCGASYVTDEAHKYEDATYKCGCGALYSGIYTDANGDKFFVVEGVAIANKGLVRVFENGEAKYYYFGCAATANDSHEDNSCDAYKAQKNCTHWVENTNGLLPAWDYTFGADGAIVYDDELNNNEQQSHKIVTYGDVKYYTIDGIKVPMGLVKFEGAYYYVRSNGALVCGQTYWVSKTNDLLPEGSYTFDEEGKMVDAPELPEVDENTNGVVGGYYYENGELTYAGLVKIEGDYYYIRSNGKAATGTYWITKTNGLLPEGSYTFDEEGKMVNAPELPEVDENTNGVVDGYYFENGVITYAGLIKLDGAYYYVRSNGQVVTGSYWVSKTNGLLPEGRYTFDEEGKMMDAPELPEVEEGFTGIKDGYYYENGVITYAGLIQLEGKYYYVRTSGKLATGQYWVTKTNGLLPEGSYNFGADGAMILE